MEHEFSGYTVNGIRKALDKLGYAAELNAAVSPTTREALNAGGVFKFQPGVAMDEVLVVLARLKGPDAVADLMEETTRSSLEGVVGPLARMFLTLKGGEPSVLLERFNDLLKGTARGISSTWTAKAPRTGRLVITYVREVDPVVAHGWRGALRYVMTFCKAQGTVRVGPPSADKKSVTLDVEWLATKTG